MGSMDSSTLWGIALALVIVAIIGVIAFLMMRGRARELGGLAAARGLRYTKRDDALVGRYGGELYALNVIEGERDGHAFVVYDSTRTKEDEEGGTPKSVSVVAVRLGRRMPELRCERRKGLLGGGHGIQTGDAEFDKHYTTTGDAGFAAAVLVPPVRQLLLAGKARWFACRGDAVVLCADGRYKPDGLDKAAESVVRLVGTIPAAVWDRLPPA